LKVDNVDAVRMSGGKLFHAAGPAMPNDLCWDVVWYEARRGVHGHGRRRGF